MSSILACLCFLNWFSSVKRYFVFLSLKHFIKIYKDLGSEKLEPIPVALLLKHPYMEDLVINYQEHALPVSTPFPVTDKLSDIFLRIPIFDAAKLPKQRNILVEHSHFFNTVWCPFPLVCYFLVPLFYSVLPPASSD